MVFAVSVIIAALFACLICLSLRLSTVPSFLLSFYLFAAAHIIIACEIAGTLAVMNSRFFVLSVQLLLTGLAFVGWYLKGKPVFSECLPDAHYFFDRKIIASSIAKRPLLWVLGCGVVLVYCLNAVLILMLPPNNFDSMTTNLSRVGYWLQRGSMYPWPTENYCQTIYPVNAQLSFYWTVLFSGTDRFAGLIQWSAVPASAAAIFGTARLLGYGRPQAVFAALIWATFPEIVLESSTTQTHLLASTFFVIGLYFLLLGLRVAAKSPLLLSGMGFSLAVGTSQFIFFALPGLALFLMLVMAREGSKTFKKLVLWSGFGLAALLLVGCYMYAMNSVLYHHPLGPPKIVASCSSPSTVSRSRQIIANSARFIYQASDVTMGFPKSGLTEKVNKLKGHLFASLFSLLKVPIYEGTYVDFDLYRPLRIHEDFAWFGPVSVLLFPVAFLYQAWLGLSRRDLYRLGILAIAILFLIALAGFNGDWTPHKNRYFILVASICSPFLAFYYQDGKKYSVLVAAIVSLCLFVLCGTLYAYESRPLVFRFLRADRIAQQTMNLSKLDPVIRMVERLVPQDEPLGMFLGENDWDYPFFGERFQRKLVQLSPQERVVDKDWLNSRSIRFILVSPAAANKLHAPHDYQLMAENFGWSLFYRHSEGRMDWQPAFLDKLLHSSRASIVQIDDRLDGAVGAVDLKLPSWGKEMYQQYIWLGNAPDQGAEFTLFSRQAMKVYLVLEAMAGPARYDAKRKVSLVQCDPRGDIGLAANFEQNGSLFFPVYLKEGLNRFIIRALDTPTVTAAPNGDTRPLLVGLGKITVYGEAFAYIYSRGWYPAEPYKNTSMRWAHQNSRIEIISQQAQTVHFCGQINSLQHPNVIDVELNNRIIASRPVNWLQYKFRPFDCVQLPLGRGRNVLTLKSRNPDAYAKNDPRGLAILVTGISFTSQESSK